MGAVIMMKNPETGSVKKGFYGFSWTTLFFTGIPALLRKDIFTGILATILGVWTLGLLTLIWAFFYNKVYTIKLLKAGYVFDDNDDVVALALSKLRLTAEQALAFQQYNNNISTPEYLIPHNDTMQESNTTTPVGTDNAPPCSAHDIDHYNESASLTIRQTFRTDNRSSFLLPVIGITFSIILLLIAWHILQETELTPPAKVTHICARVTKPKAPNPLAFYHTNISPLITELQSNNKKAEKQALTSVHKIFDGYRDRIPTFADDVTSWSTRLD